MLNLEERAIAALRSAGALAYADVPANRPEEFATVEALGGSQSQGGWLVTSGVAVQAWAPTRYRASCLAIEWRGVLRGALEADMEVLSCDLSAPYSFPSADGLPRYQFTCDVTSHDR